MFDTFAFLINFAQRYDKYCWTGCSFWSIFKHQPYCLVDPTCVSPVGQGGFALNDFTDMNSFGGLAWLNYVLFMLLLSAILVAAIRVLRRQRPVWRRVTLAAVLCWCVFEHARWFSVLNWSEASGAQTRLIFQMGALLVFSLLVFVGVYMCMVRKTLIEGAVPR